jgi:hypothetical protein
MGGVLQYTSMKGLVVFAQHQTVDTAVVDKSPLQDYPLLVPPVGNGLTQGKSGMTYVQGPDRNAARTYSTHTA